MTVHAAGSLTGHIQRLRQRHHEAEHALLTGRQSPTGLFIRCRGSQRLSRYAAWDLGHADLRFCDKHWGGFEREDLHSALDSYAARQCRFDYQREGRP
ncbi:undecaprenyl diphosphate synthase family protein [Streptomyces sp. NPDC059256]|uniref:undecaprenyl diphosphate synthase family protein n=1 Tax=Streptomyces sp. NPDC059256 TaxID=3346794 RepID=UPI0036B50EA2